MRESAGAGTRGREGGRGAPPPGGVRLVGGGWESGRSWEPAIVGSGMNRVLACVMLGLGTGERMILGFLVGPNLHWA